MKTKQQILKAGYKVTFTNGDGKGGQKRNRTYSVAVVTHEATGITERSDDTRSANKNMNVAYEKILKQLSDSLCEQAHQRINDRRQDAMNKGTIRTYDYKRGMVKNHITGNEASLKKVLNGHLDLIQD